VERIDDDRKIICNGVYRKRVKWYELQSTGLGYGLVAGSCKHRDEHSGFKKVTHFLTSLVGNTLTRNATHSDRRTKGQELEEYYNEKVKEDILTGIKQ
jgi:hypothetical protein